MKYQQLIQTLEAKTEIDQDDTSIREIWKLLLRFSGYVAVVMLFSFYLVMYLIVYVVGSAWREGGER